MSPTTLTAIYSLYILRDLKFSAQVVGARGFGSLNLKPDPEEAPMELSGDYMKWGWRNWMKREALNSMVTKGDDPEDDYVTVRVRP